MIHSRMNSAENITSTIKQRFRSPFINYLDPLFKYFVPAFCHALNGGRGGNDRGDAYAVMTTAVVLGHLHPRPDDPIAAGQSERIYIAVRSCRCAADDFGHSVRLHDSHIRLGVAYSPLVCKEHYLAANMRRGWGRF